ncbi:hypothetical protein SLEP1_g18826 [Rubroshorea leprosula]|uniref:Uncharacterized protein n=1 Tax=Rubroshorea leprosula TaxID=152421 RepID=A0AAV5JAM2_9ROSI|nr:hypothetical protein SLEP1_g18826 [Rubroshorea leprosula]
MEKTPQSTMEGLIDKSRMNVMDNSNKFEKLFKEPERIRSLNANE